MRGIGGASACSHCCNGASSRRKSVGQRRTFHGDEGVLSWILPDRRRGPERGGPNRVANAARSRGEYRGAAGPGVDEYKRRSKTGVVAVVLPAKRSRLSMKADISTLHKPDILILQRQWITAR